MYLTDLLKQVVKTYCRVSEKLRAGRNYLMPHIDLLAHLYEEKLFLVVMSQEMEPIPLSWKVVRR